MELTESELVAKKHFIDLLTEGKDIPIDPSEGFGLNFEKPSWFDEEKYELGRQYFFQNRFGILNSNIYGLIVLLSAPKGLETLNATNRSNKPETARRRYAETILHTLAWFDVQLTNDSKSWQSLKKVRRMHLNASRLAMKRNIGFISQMEVACTTFGFAGFVINRPHLFGIKHDNDEDREGFVHFWAVMNYMLGVEDRFNICLLPLEAVQIEFELIMRHILNFYIQFETTLFKEMVGALIEGLKEFLPMLDYKTAMFLTRRAIGVPGYQYNVDLEKEKPHRNIFSQEDIKTLKAAFPVFSEKLQVFKYIKNESNGFDSNNNSPPKSISKDQINWDYDHLNLELILDLCDLPKNISVVAEEYEKSEDLSPILNGDQYNELSNRVKINVGVNDRVIKSLNYRMGNFLMEKFMTYTLNKIKNSPQDEKYIPN